MKQNKKQIVVLGAGFGGIRAALDLARKSRDFQVVLIDHKSFHLYHPALHEVATSLPYKANALSLKRTIAIPVTDITGRYKNITFKQSWVQGIEPDRQLVHTDDGDLSYDALVVALGSQTDFYGIPGLTEHAYSLKSFDDAVRIRNHIYNSFAEFDRTGDAAHLSFIVGGGGFTGVEFACELSGLLKKLIKQRRGTLPNVPIWVIEGAGQLLPGMSPRLSMAAKDRLASLGVNIVTGRRITEARPDGVILDNKEMFPGHTVIWTGGVRSCKVPFVKNISVDNKDRIILSSRLNLENHPEVFVVGDNACWLDPNTGRAEPQTAQMAVYQAKHAAAAIAAILSGGEAPLYRSLKSHSYIVTLGGKHAALLFRGSLTVGLPGYVARRLADLYYLLTVLPWLKAVHLWLRGTFVYTKND